MLDIDYYETNTLLTAINHYISTGYLDSEKLQGAKSLQDKVIKHLMDKALEVAVQSLVKGAN